MILILILILGFISFLGILTNLIWSKIEFSWLNKICRFLVLSLPFERIPSVDFGFGNIRISQLLTLLGIYFFFILIFKRDKKLLEHKIDNSFWLILGFFVVSIPSWFVVQDFKRFLITMIGTLLVFLAYFLLSNFSKNILELLQELNLVLILVCLFGIYQIVGDFVGLPIIATGLRYQYTKVVFGIARVHATALEPLYFAGMLFPGIFSSIFLIAKQKPILNLNFKFQKNIYFNILIFSLFCSLFLATISKGAFLSIALLLPFLVLIFYQLKLLKNLSFVRTLALAFLGFIFFLNLFSQEFSTILIGIINNFIGSLFFDSGTSAERIFFVQAANFLLFYNIVVGIGSGQFGILADNLIPLSKTPGTYLIVNNVYLEIWLEFGFLALILFLILLFRTIYSNYKIYQKTFSQNLNNDNLARLILIFSLASYFINWLFFSPIFIMPIFILLGLASNLISQFPTTIKQNT
jgi:hypothetical protein